MHRRLNRKKNQISDFSDFYCSSYGHFCTLIFDEFFMINQKIKIFHSFQHIAIIHENRIKTEGGGLHILSWEILYCFISSMHIHKIKFFVCTTFNLSYKNMLRMTIFVHLNQVPNSSHIIYQP